METKQVTPRWKEPWITNRLIVEFHRRFKLIVKNAMIFFGARQSTLVLFNFTTTPTHYQIRIKFVSTHKMIKVTVPIAGDDTCFNYQTYVKTRNIVRDIDQIYLPQENGTSTIFEMDRLIDRLFLWGIQPYRVNPLQKKQNYFKAVPVALSKMAEGEPMEYNKLYYGFITYLEVNPQPNNLATVLMCLDGTMMYSVPDVDPARFDMIRVHRVYIQNSDGKFNIMGLKSARHHLLFTEEQFNSLEELAKACEDSIVDDEFY